MSGVKRTVGAVFVLVGIICIIAGINYCSNGFDKKDNYYKIDNKYVGGDAYNYITNAGYFSGYLALGGAVIVTGALFLTSGAKIALSDNENNVPRQAHISDNAYGSVESANISKENVQEPLDTTQFTTHKIAHKKINVRTLVKLVLIMACSIAVIFSATSLVRYFSSLGRAEAVYSEAIELYNNGDYDASLEKINELNQEDRARASDDINEKIDKLWIDVMGKFMYEK